MPNVMEINGGDISCVHFVHDDFYEVYISRYGEMDRYALDSIDEIESYLKDFYDFTDEMIQEFKSIIVENTNDNVL